MAEIADKPKIHEINRFTMFTAAPGVEGKQSRLAWCVRDGQPRITVYTNIPSDASNMYGILSANMNPETFFVFLDELEKIALGQSNVKRALTCYTSFRQENGSYGEKKLMSKLLFGKDENGMVWLSVVAENRPKIKFEIKFSDWHELLLEDGTSPPASELSVAQTLAICKAMRVIYARLVSEFRQPKPFTNNRAGAGSTDKPFTKSNPPTSTLDFASLDDIAF